jgi:hypothetical protein
MMFRFPLAIVTLLACGTSNGLAGSVNVHGENSRGLYQINIAPSSTQGPTMRPWTTTHGMSVHTPVRPTIMIRPSMGTFRVR